MPLSAPRRLFRKLAARERLSVAVVGLLAFGVALGLSLIRAPLPRVHDEFSYLLAADTFARGRLSNPTHPLWPYFETFHVLQTPRYASKYPPAQGLFLAAGQLLTGRPIAGAWLAVALGSAGVCWMLQGWTRPRWALLGGTLTALHHGVHGGIGGWGVSYSWSQSFWGGGPAMLGGALVVGALPRLVRDPRRGDALLLGLGLVLLASSRPFEGLLVSLPVLAALAGSGVRLRSIITPLLLVLVPAALAMGAVNQSVTGSPFRLPYALYESTYNPVPIVTTGRAPSAPPVYRHEVLRRFFTEWCAEQWEAQRTWPGWWRYHRERFAWLSSFFVGPLVIPLAMLPWVVRSRKNAFAAAECAAVILAHLATVGIQPHYAAPVFGCFMLLVVEGLRRLAVVRVGVSRVGRAAVGLTVLMAVLKLGLVAQARAGSEPGWEAERARVASALEASGGRHLVVVRYAPDHDLLDEWVANSAEIDASSVVWAREMDGPSMRRLLGYFHDRHAWLVEADAQPARLTPYPTDPRPSP
jgi:hypothetical protein